MKAPVICVGFLFCAHVFAQSTPQTPPPASQAVPPPASSQGTGTPITRSQAEQQALKNNPRITAIRLLALASGQVTRETRASALPQVGGNLTAVDAEDGGRIGAGSLTASRLYTHAGAGVTLSQLLTDFGRTSNLIANAKLQEKAQQQTALATEQDVLLATDEAFYRLLDAQSLLNAAKATVQARGQVQSLTQALTKAALKSDLDLNIAAADYSQAQLFQLDAENAVASASAALAALLAAPPTTMYAAVETPGDQLPPPPDDAAPLIREAQTQRPDLKALQLNTQAEDKYARAEADQRLPTISALGTSGITPVRADGAFPQNWYGGVGVNLNIPVFTGFRISAQAQEARLRERASEQQSINLANGIARDVRVATLTAQTAFRRIGVTEQFRTEAAQAFTLAQTRYRLGLSSIVELSQAQQQSTQADVTAINARYDYLMALRSLDYARGSLVP